MKSAIILLNFGEPENATPEDVLPFLERIFASNASLEGDVSEAAIRARSRELAERRAPGLIAEYRAIGGSPLNRQADAQARALAAELRRRGHAARTYVGMQFTEPSLRAAAERARADGARRLVGLPVYPLCGPSTTVAALQALAHAVRELNWDVELRELTGWHTHPDYVRLRADGIVATARAHGLDLADPRTRLVFSAHGTPIKYLEEGSRYDLYVRDNCRAIAGAAGAPEHVIGYQNHGNRRIEWTQPDIEAVIASLDADHAIVVPVSFMHEQSETLAELDIELKEEAEQAGLAFHRVPVPHDDPRFAALLADIVQPLLGGPARDDVVLRRCICRPVAGACCLNAQIRPEPAPARSA